MTKKKVIALFSLLLVIASVIVIMTTFTLKSVSIFFVSPTSTVFDSSQMIKCGEFEIGKSLFLQHKDINIAKIEKKTPYAKVLKIETKFPNKFVVHVKERDPLYALYNAVENSYVVLDEDFKVLSILDEEEYLDVFEVQPIVINCSNYTIVYNFGEGDFISLSHANQVFGTLCTSLHSYDYDTLAMKNMLKDVSFNMLNNQLMISTYYGTTILIDKIDFMFDAKIGVAFDGYEKLKQDNLDNMVIIVSDDGADITYEFRQK